MSFKYFPHTEGDIDAMLSRIGVQSLDDLYADVPEGIRFKGEYDLPEAKSEVEVRRFLTLCAVETGSLRALPVPECTIIIRLR